MISMQYKITLPTDYDMEIIRERTRKNGHKTDDFTGLNFKCYLMTEKGQHGNMQNSYAPLYLWNDVTGMNSFIFDGYYDNIIGSFGWQEIGVNVPYTVNIHDDMVDVKYAIETVYTLLPEETIADFGHVIEDMFSMEENENYMVLYNPTAWAVTYYRFVEVVEDLTGDETVYEILHVSR